MTTVPEQNAAVEERIRKVVSRQTPIGSAADTVNALQNLWELGIDSLASVRMMIGIEEEFGIQFPESLLTRSTFENIASIAGAVRGLLSTEHEATA